MKNKEFQKLVDDLFMDCMATLIKKGTEYQSNSPGKDDVFSNFKRTAKDLGIDPLAVIKIFMNKHWDSLTTFCRDYNLSNGNLKEIEEKLSEPIEGRIMDLINYLLILHAYIIEQRRNKNVS